MQNMEGIIGLESFDPEQKCFCEEPDETLYVTFNHNGGKCKFCSHCGVVRREIDFGETNSTSDDDTSEEELPEIDPELQITELNERIISPEKAAILTPGSHIAWVKKMGKLLRFLPGNYSHHAVVEKNDGEYLNIIHYAKDKDHNQVIRIHRERLCIASYSEMGYEDLYLIKYPKRIIKKNPPPLVLERAVARLGEELYNPVINNCETFVTFCKTGFPHSLQISARQELCVKKLRSTLSSFSNKPKVTMWTNGLLTKDLIKASLPSDEDYRPRLIDDSLHVFTEEMICTSNMQSLFKERRDKDLDWEKFVDKLLAKLNIDLKEFLLIAAATAVGGAVGFAAGVQTGVTIGSVAFSPVPGVGTAIGAVCGGTVGLVSSVLVVKYLRSSRWQYSNKETVTSVEKLRIGDHIVLRNKRWFHRHCHGIVTKVNKKQSNISVIGNLHDRGVVEQEIPFKELTRITYAFGTCYRPWEVVARARSELGRDDLSNINCKQFVEAHKKKR